MARVGPDPDGPTGGYLGAEGALARWCERSGTQVESMSLW